MLALKYPTYPWQQLYLLNTRYKQQASMEEALEILFPVLRTLSPGPTEDSLTISLWFVGCTQNTQRKKRGGTSQPHNRVIYGTRCLHTFVTSWIWIQGILSHTLRTATWKNNNNNYRKNIISWHPVSFAILLRSSKEKTNSKNSSQEKKASMSLLFPVGGTAPLIGRTLYQTPVLSQSHLVHIAWWGP